MKITWLGIVVIALLLFLAIAGYTRGLIRELISSLFLILSLVIVWVINPYVNQFLHENTVIDQKMESVIAPFVDEQLQKISPGVNAQTTDGGILDENIIELLSLPENIKEGLKNNNTSDVYSFLSANTSTEYLTHYLEKSIVNGISFIISFLIANILLRILAYVLNILSHLPLINGANRILGTLLGCAKGIVFVWIGILILTILCNTEVGAAGLKLVENDAFLSFLNKYNVIVKVFMGIFYN